MFCIEHWSNCYSALGEYSENIGPIISGLINLQTAQIFVYIKLKEQSLFSILSYHQLVSCFCFIWGCNFFTGQIIYILLSAIFYLFHTLPQAKYFFPSTKLDPKLGLVLTRELRRGAK